ncbi:hypothetical protein PYCC9005_005463 [Savitreella phatthalungensis]
MQSLVLTLLVQIVVAGAAYSDGAQTSYNDGYCQCWLRTDQYVTYDGQAILEQRWDDVPSSTYDVRTDADYLFINELTSPHLGRILIAVPFDGQRGALVHFHWNDVYFYDTRHQSRTWRRCRGRELD